MWLFCVSGWPFAWYPHNILNSCFDINLKNVQVFWPLSPEEMKSLSKRWATMTSNHLISPRGRANPSRSFLPSLAQSYLSSRIQLVSLDETFPATQPWVTLKMLRKKRRRKHEWAERQVDIPVGVRAADPSLPDHHWPSALTNRPPSSVSHWLEAMRPPVILPNRQRWPSSHQRGG